MRSALILEILSRIRKRDYSAQDMLTAVVKLGRELGLENDAAALAVWHRRGRAIGVWYRRSMTKESGLTDELQAEAARFIGAACGRSAARRRPRTCQSLSAAFGASRDA